MKTVLAWIAAALILLLIPFACGGYGVVYKKTIGVQSESARREVFKETKSYNEGMVQDLARYKLEYERSKDVVARKAIIDHIITSYSNFDDTRIENRSLREFLKDVRSGKL